VSEWEAWLKALPTVGGALAYFFTYVSSSICIHGETVEPEK